MEPTKVRHLRVALISDTHGTWDEPLKRAVSEADELWHAGDLGPIAEHLRAWEAKVPGRRLRVVTGNIDGVPLTLEFPKELDFTVEGVRVWMIHIGGYPGRYAPSVRTSWPAKRASGPVDLFVCGHSHVLRVLRDNQHRALCLNPGACGTHGFHSIRTLLRFSLHAGKIMDMEAVELGPRGKLDPDHNLPDPY